MGPGPRRWLVLPLALLALGSCGSTAAAAAANGGWITLVNKPSRFRLTVPRSCYVVPDDSVAKTRALIAQLEEQKQTRLAGVYSGIIDTTEVARFAFEAFFYSPSAQVQPTVTLAVARTTRAATSAKGLEKVAAAVSKSLRGQGATVGESKLVALPAGPARLLEATEPVGGQSTLLEVYVLGHGTLLYQLTFRTAAASRSGLSTLTEIAHRFAVT